MIYHEYEIWKRLKDAGYPQRDFANFSFAEEPGEDGIYPCAMIVSLEELMEECAPFFHSLHRNKEPFEDGTQWFVNYYSPTGECDARGATATEALVNLWISTHLPVIDIFEDVQ